MPDDDHTVAHRKVEAARTFCLDWLERLGDLKTADEAYDNDMHKLQREVDAEKEKIFTPGLDRHEMARIAERMLELRVQLRDLETSRESTSDARKKAHSELRRAQLKDLVDGIKGIAGETSWVTASPRQAALPAPEQGNQHPHPGSRQAKSPPSKLDHHDLEKLQRGDGNAQNTNSESPGSLRDKSHGGRVPLEKENPSPSSDPSNSSQPPPTPPVRPTPEAVLSQGRRSAPKRRAAVESDNARRAGLGGTTAEIADESPSRPIKRRRVDDHPSGGEEEVDSPSEPLPEPGSFAKRAIRYDDVHQNGRAKYRHFIVEYKGKYYICICEVHGLHFKGDILRGVGTHINSPKHNCGSRLFSVGLELLGIQVLGCNSTLADKHNRMLTAAIEKGEYTVLDWCNLPREQQEQIPLSSCGLAALKRSGSALPKGQSGTTSPHSRAGTTPSGAKFATAASRRKGRRSSQPQRGFKGVTDAVPGKAYFGQRPDGTWCGLIALPRGEVFGDPTFEEIGFPSALADTQVLRTVPGCYRYSRFQRRYLGWDEGFEDGGASVTRREFPVILFDGRPFPSQSQVAWVSAQDLRPYDLTDPSAVGVPNLHSFGKLLKERRNKLKDEIEVEGDKDDEDTDEDDQDEDEDEAKSADESDADHDEEKEHKNGKGKGKGKENKGGAGKNTGDGGRQRPQDTNGPTKETTRTRPSSQWYRQRISAPTGEASSVVSTVKEHARNSDTLYTTGEPKCINKCI
ncbi:uncharacterized protein DNG_06367 [Cephalotrichum gorgonifer]|uniref:Uncharacterized protein n=1 Tax=Cephalotrichum gorgonifer TaxID=2041049 RepID=A0AAE8N1H8_9PEZI|nr:uncharacterized protein DNG_06367 [Cephalotrichum gorgonifer]